MSKSQLLSKIDPSAKYRYIDRIINRTRCVLCNGTTVTKLVSIIPNLVSIPSCALCLSKVNELNIDEDTIVSIINKKVKMPICFLRSGKTVKFIKDEFLKPEKCRITYNQEERKKKNNK